MSRPTKNKPLTLLGIETSCDETAAAVVRRASDGNGEILSSVMRSQFDLHAAYGGVVPEIAARAHVELLDVAIKQALAEAEFDFDALDGVAAASGPGLIGGLIVGVGIGAVTGTPAFGNRLPKAFGESIGPIIILCH